MEIVFAGFGGQGVLTAGLITANVARMAGKEVLWMPAYGGQMRGGKSYSLVKLDNKPICHPDIEQLDILVAMNRPSLMEFSRYVKEGGLLLINSDTIDDAVIPDCTGARIIRAPFASEAHKVKNVKGANIVALGMMCALSPEFENESFEEGLLDYFETKGKQSFANLNIAAFREGIRMAGEIKC